LWPIAIGTTSAEEPAAQLKAILKERDSGAPGFREAATDAERNAALDRGDRFALRLLEFAEKNPRDPTAIDALVECIRSLNAVDSLTEAAWEMNRSAFPVHAKSNVAERANALLLREYVASERIGPVCLRLSYSLRRSFQPFLHRVLEANPHKDVRAIACLALAGSLNSRLQKLDLAMERPESARRYEELLGKDDFDQLRREGHEKLTKEVESLLELAAGQYGGEKHPYGGTIGKVASAELFEIRNLAIGKVLPDIEGVDQDGKHFKLSDYRGKVVLLDFWQEL
jgi:hypothetical protein